MELVGPPREFHVDPPNSVAIDGPSSTDASDNPGRLSRTYTEAMVESIRRHAFSSAATGCVFTVRIRSDEQGDEQGALAAAACVIKEIRDRNPARQFSDSAAYVERAI
jgi:hypothetical protein